MADLGRRATINEILIKYKLEPTLPKTIYVEGSSDKSFIELFLKRCNIKNIAVFEIQMVEIEAEMVFEKGLNDNNRDRIILLSILVSQGVIGIIDSDFDFIEKPNYTKPSHLLSTDYSAMELYGFNEETLEKIFLCHTSKKPKLYQEFLNMLGSILVEIFLIRFAKKKIEASLTHKDFNKNLSLKSKIITFDRDAYLKKYVDNRQPKIEEFNSFIEEQKKSLPDDIRKIIHGHDFVELLKFYLEIKQKDAKDIFEKSFYGFFDFNLLKEEKMFKDLIKMIK
jgi:hypothetical protein